MADGSQILRVNFSVLDVLAEPLIKLLNAGEVYLLMKAERDRVETKLMELELSQRMVDGGSNQQGDDWLGFHGERDCEEP